MAFIRLYYVLYSGGYIPVYPTRNPLYSLQLSSLHHLLSLHLLMRVPSHSRPSLNDNHTRQSIVCSQKCNLVYFMTDHMPDLMRVVRHGLEVKAVVDHYIDQCSGFFGLRESIEESAIKAEEATDEQQRWRYIEQGWYSLFYLATGLSELA